MVGKLHFKGDKKTKKRKRAKSPENEDGTEQALAKQEDLGDDTWVTMDEQEELSGPIMLTLVCALSIYLRSQSHCDRMLLHQSLSLATLQAKYSCRP